MNRLMRFVPALLLLALVTVMSGCLPGAGEQEIFKVDPTWSPDGTKVAFASNQDGDWNIYVIDLATDEVKRLTGDSANDVAPAWSPDGNQISFSSDRNGDWEIYVMRADGTDVKPLTTEE